MAASATQPKEEGSLCETAGGEGHPTDEKDERLDFFSPAFDPLLLLQQSRAREATAAGGVALPNIRVAELLLPWGHQPRNTAAAAADAGEETPAAESSAGTAPATPAEGSQGVKKRSAFEARLNAEKNKQLRKSNFC